MILAHRAHLSCQDLAFTQVSKAVGFFDFRGFILLVHLLPTLLVLISGAPTEFGPKFLISCFPDFANVFPPNIITMSTSPVPEGEQTGGKEEITFRFCREW